MMVTNINDVLQEISINKIRTHIQALEGIRHPQANPKALKEAEEYIRGEFSKLGYKPQDHLFEEDEVDYVNLIATKTGTTFPEERIIVTAHYDTVSNSPGADDNASGIAGVLELARVLKDIETQRTLQFIAFNLEERKHEGDGSTPFLRGSTAMAQSVKEEDWQINALINFEMIAYAGPNIPQNLPAGLSVEGFEVGDFIAVVGSENSADLVNMFPTAAQKYQVPLRVFPMVVPGNGEMLPDVRRSDHAPFWDLGYPAVMVTDTANFRTPHYHEPTDTLDTLNLEFAAEVCRAAVAVVLEMTNKKDK